MPFQRPSGATAGILLYLLGLFFFSVNDALGKWLVTDYSVSQIMFLRGLGATLVLIPLVWRNRVSLRTREQLGLHVLRVLCSAADTYGFYYATKSLPLADVMTFYLAAPLIIVALSAPLLGERVGLGGWAAVMVGFVGVLVALHPTGAAFSPAAFVALFGATMFALSIAITRKLRQTHWMALVAYQTAGSGLVGGAACAVSWVTPSLLDVGLMFTVGIVSMSCFMCITKALAMAPASLLAPLQYSSIVWAVLLGWLIWGDMPTPTILLGIAIIVGSGLSVFSRKRQATEVQPAVSSG